MKIKDLEIEFDFLDADDVERLEKGYQKVIEETERHKEEELSMSEEIRIECQIIDEFLNYVFGEGTAEKLFNGKKSLKAHTEVFQDILNEKLIYSRDIEAVYARYQPNREQRRKGRNNV